MQGLSFSTSGGTGIASPSWWHFMDSPDEGERKGAVNTMLMNAGAKRKGVRTGCVACAEGVDCVLLLIRVC